MIYRATELGVGASDGASRSAMHARRALYGIYSRAVEPPFASIFSPHIEARYATQAIRHHAMLDDTPGLTSIGRDALDIEWRTDSYTRAGYHMS